MMADIDGAACFAPDYGTARGRFLATCAARQATVRTYSNPHTGPDGGVLATDTAWFGATDARRVVVLVSGTHGVEGFCGSGAQVDWVGGGDPGALPHGIAMLLIHGINPYGFAWLRRVTEEGVDLNRNWVDFAAPLPTNEGYDALADAIVPAAMAGPAYDAAEERLTEWRAAHGETAFEIMLMAGQFRHSNGLFYGGTEPSWARRTLQQIIADYRLAERARVAVIDYHTGLGPYGTGEPICGHWPDTVGQWLTRAWYGDSLTEPFLGTSSSAPIAGLSQYGWLDALGDRATFIALEFGTYPPETIFQALRSEHSLYHGGRPVWDAPETRQAKAALRRAYYPDKGDWHELVIFRSRQVIRQTLAGLTDDTG